MTKPVNVGVLVSGGGTNLQAILDAECAGLIPDGRVACVIASKPGVFALTRAARTGVPGYVAERKTLGDRFEPEIIRILEEHQVGVIVLAGFLSILSPDFVRRYEGRILNVHPALLPAFGGKGCYGLHVHEQVLAAGCKVTGATVHLVNEVCDGGEILLQRAVAVEPGDTPETLQRRVMEQAEWKLLPQAVELVCKRLRDASAPEKSNDTEDKTMERFETLLSQNRYPGRGILIGLSPDGARAMIGYFIMGRSENSRNRVFVEEGDVVRTEAFDPAKLTDPSLVIYAPVRVLGEHTVVTNGDQTDTIVDFMQRGLTFEDALRTRRFEPDPPILTPRISGLVSVSEGKLSYRLSILKAGGEESCLRFFYEYAEPKPGEGHLIHTYRCDGDPVPSFEGEPKTVAVGNDLRAFGDALWQSLDPERKVSLLVRSVELSGGKYEQIIYNKNQK